jgi:molybdopterin synthase sulfur carrier subunit
MITLLYFARLREALGTGREQIALPAGVTTLGALRTHLAQRGLGEGNGRGPQSACRGESGCGGARHAGQER